MAALGDQHQRFRRSMWGMIAYLLGFAIFITIIARYYLLPAMHAAADATPGERQQLSAYSLLLMSIVLLIVIVGIILTFRISRFFFPRPPHQPSRTQYVDAWSESARRMSELPDEDEKLQDDR